MLCENMQGREEDELLGMAEVFLGKYISSRGGRQYRLCRLFFLKGIITNDNSYGYRVDEDYCDFAWSLCVGWKRAD